mmetsp:Transcript_11988/g.38623  ORF Transcript_11988/g.38623 Transcript_11988/m.38623 type:complete len:227 (-) Transcript_11988:566-1246(-)
MLAPLPRRRRRAGRRAPPRRPRRGRLARWRRGAARGRGGRRRQDGRAGAPRHLRRCRVPAGRLRGRALFRRPGRGRIPAGAGGACLKLVDLGSARLLPAQLPGRGGFMRELLCPGIEGARRAARWWPRWGSAALRVQDRRHLQRPVEGQPPERRRHARMERPRELHGALAEQLRGGPRPVRARGRRRLRRAVEAERRSGLRDVLPQERPYNLRWPVGRGLAARPRR